MASYLGSNKIHEMGDCNGGVVREKRGFDSSVGNEIHGVRGFMTESRVVAVARALQLHWNVFGYDRRNLG